MNNNTNTPQVEDKYLERYTRAQREILQDVREGIVPATVSCFSDLHDHVDANKYGGFTEDGYQISHEWEFECYVQHNLSIWIQGGGITKALTHIIRYPSLPEITGIIEAKVNFN